MRYLPAVLIALLASSVLCYLFISPSSRGPNRAEQFVHMVVPNAVCTSLYSGDGLFPDSADCILGTTVQFCRASTLAPPTCVKIADLAPPPAKP